MSKDACGGAQQDRFVFGGSASSRTSALDSVELPLLCGNNGMKNGDGASGELTEAGGSTTADHHPNQLSGGQQQRVAMRGRHNNPSIVLASRPGTHTKTSIEVMDIFQRLNRDHGSRSF